MQGEFVTALEEIGHTVRPHAAGTLGDMSGKPGEPLSATDRIKTAPTLIDKLRRGTRLSSMQDIVGFRVKGAMSLAQQDLVVAWLVVTFPGGRVVDRRSDPSHGYRAVHVVLVLEGFQVEVQVRTQLQDVWANSTERIGDAWGRWLRYGLPPEGDTDDVRRARAEVVHLNVVLSDEIRVFELFADDLLGRRRPFLQRDLDAANATLQAHVDRFVAARDRTLKS